MAVGVCGWEYNVDKVEVSPCNAYEYLYVDPLKFHPPLPSQASDTRLKCQPPHTNDDDERMWLSLLLKPTNRPTNRPPSQPTNQLQLINSPTSLQ